MICGKHSLAGLYCWLALVLVVANLGVEVDGLRLVAKREQQSRSSLEESDTARIARSRGYIAEEHRLISVDGYNISLTRILNPCINEGRSGLRGKRPIFFVPGETSSGSIYLSGSEDVKPEDLSNQDIHDQQVRESLACCKPSAKVLPLLSSNYGHEVWIINRRATPGSFNHTLFEAYINDNIEIGKTKSPVSDRCTSDNPEAGDYDTNEELLRTINEYVRESIDSRYWNYSLDQLARFDLPQAINYALDISQQDKLAIVAWSSGCSLTLMMLIAEPAFNKRVSNAILLAPTFFRAPTADILTNSAGPALAQYVGPFSGKFHITKQVQCLLKRGCYARYGKSACDATPEVPPGRIGNRPTTNQERELTSSYSVSSHQMLQLQQNIDKPMHYFDYGDPATNFLHYGQAGAPVYDLSRVTLDKISVWYGAFDEKATNEEVSRLTAALKVPANDVHFFNDSDIYFDHSSVVFHREVSSLVNLPALEEIERLSDF